MKKIIVFRVDASVIIGSGHVMRCLTLAEELRKKKSDCRFICREMKGNLCDYIEKKGFIVYRLPYRKLHSHERLDKNTLWAEEIWQNDAEQMIRILRSKVELLTVDCLIVDHYAFDVRWEVCVRPYVKKIMVIDDLANRIHDADIILDQNYYLDMDSRYDGLLPLKCLKFFGPKYALIREEFIKARKDLKVRNGQLENILVFFGGSDPTDETYKTFKVLQELYVFKFNIDVVVGESNQNKGKIAELCKKSLNCKYHCQINNMAELMNKADLAIGAAGTTTWERCYLGLPAIVFCIADNQKKIAEEVAQFGAHVFVDFDLNEIQNIKKFQDLIMQLRFQKEWLKNISDKAFKLMSEHNIDDIYYELLR